MNISNNPDNPFTAFYGEHQISPVHQDLSDPLAHELRRRKLYHQLGIPTLAFRNSRVLEVGPAGGENAAVLLGWGANLDLVEPNPTAIEELKTNLGDISGWKLHPCTLEQVEETTQYDIVVAEGILPGLKHPVEFLRSLESRVADNGILVITCADALSGLMDIGRRALAHKLLQEHQLNNFTEQVLVLSEAFSTHLATLGNGTRSIADWVADQLLNSTWRTRLFGIGEALEVIGPRFKVLGASPQLFNDLSWYKDLSTSCSSDAFSSIQHVLVDHTLPLSLRSPEKNRKLYRLAEQWRVTVAFAEESFTSWETVAQELGPLIALVRPISEQAAEGLEEVANLLNREKLSAAAIATMKKLTPLFGRGQQYLSFIHS